MAQCLVFAENEGAEQIKREYVKSQVNTAVVEY